MKPVIMSGIVNRTQDYAQLKQGEDQKPAADQANFQSQFNKQIEKNAELVIRQNNSEWKNEKFDAKEKGKNKYFADKKKKEKKEEDGKVTAKSSHISFDVKI